MFLKYTNTSICLHLCFLQNKDGSLLSECSITESQIYMFPKRKRYGTSFYNIFSTTHISDSESMRRNRNYAYSSYFSKRPISIFIYVFIKGSFGPRVLSSHSYQFPLRVGLPFQLNYFYDNVSFKMIICLKFKLIKVTYPIKNILGSRTTF